MTDLDAMEYNGRTHRGKEGRTPEDSDYNDDDDETPGEETLWDELDTL